jgi:hypothetical protein
MKRIWREGYGRINGGLRVLELAADNREVAPTKGTRYSLTIMLTSSKHNRGNTNARHHQQRGLYRREERRGMAVAILIITRRRKIVMHGGFLIMSVPPRPLDAAMATMPYPIGDHALPYRYPLSPGTPNTRECEPG